MPSNCADALLGLPKNEVLNQHENGRCFIVMVR
jgi:hypothetical protein